MNNLYNNLYRLIMNVAFAERSLGASSRRAELVKEFVTKARFKNDFFVNLHNNNRFNQ